MKRKSIGNVCMFILMGVTCVAITATGIVFGQELFHILPLYVSLVIALLQSRVNRFAPLLGGVNSILYTVVYFTYTLYGQALYALLVSCPLQLVTFFHWSKRKYGESVRFKRLPPKGRLLTLGCFAVTWIAMYLAMSYLGSGYMLLDNTITLFSILITILTMLAYIEYTWLMLPNCVISIVLYAVMLKSSPEQITYLIFSVYSLICNTIAFLKARRLFKEQHEIVPQSLSKQNKSREIVSYD